CTARAPSSKRSSSLHELVMTESAPTSMPETTIDIERILQILPHRWPFVLVDRVNEIVSFERIRGHKCVSMNEPWFLGHFPARPIMPGVLILESLAQLGGILAYASEPFDTGSSLMYFLGI